jgi:ribosomal protein S18 acetylase RimI-like enzyme
VVRLQRICERDGLDLKLTLERTAAGEQPLDFLAVAGRRLIGYCGVEDTADAEVCGMVHPDHRGRGVGTALLDRALRAARRAGRDSVVVICEDAAPHAIDWLRRHGGQVEGSEQRMVLRLDGDHAAAPPPATAGDPVVLRRARAKDRERVIRWLTPEFDQTADVVARLFDERMGSTTTRVLVAWAGDDPVGTLRLVAVPGRAMIYGFVVDPARRGRGRGAAMLRATLDLLRAEGARDVALEVDPDNTPAVRLYTRSGFRVVTTYRYVRVATVAD